MPKVKTLQFSNSILRASRSQSSMSWDALPPPRPMLYCSKRPTRRAKHLETPGFTLAGHTNSKHHGLATFVKDEIKWELTGKSTKDAAVEWITINIHDTIIVNMYKPSPTQLEQSSLPDALAPAPAIYAGDFNCGHTNWGYKSCNQDGEFLVDRASASDATLLFDPKEPATFLSGRWKTETNPDLAFAKVHTQEPLSVRRVLDCFLRSQHRPSLITTLSLVQPTSRKPVHRWNFHKANWSKFEREVKVTAGTLPVPSADNIDEAYEAYCKMLLDAAKKHIPRECRANHIPCCDDQCEDLLNAHTEATSSEERASAATDLFARLDNKRKEGWTETIESIDFTHSSRRAWQTISKLTG